jgi:hypothetical protein
MLSTTLATRYWQFDTHDCSCTLQINVMLAIRTGWRFESAPSHYSFFALFFVAIMEEPKQKRRAGDSERVS